MKSEVKIFASGVQADVAKMIWGSQRRDFKIDQVVVEVCEGALAYNGALLMVLYWLVHCVNLLKL